jgi:hypothetical protein
VYKVSINPIIQSKTSSIVTNTRDNLIKASLNTSIYIKLCTYVFTHACEPWYSFVLDFLTFLCYSLQSLCLFFCHDGFGSLACAFFNLINSKIWKVGRTPWTGDKPETRPLPTQVSTKTECLLFITEVSEIIIMSVLNALRLN